MDMIKMAENKVWTFNIPPNEISQLDSKLIVNNMMDGNQIKVRYISPTCPREGAVLVEANLEDAYLCLLKEI